MKRAFLVIVAAILAACVAPIVPERANEIRASIEANREAAYNTIADLAETGALSVAEYDDLMLRMHRVERAIALSDEALAQGLPRTQLQQLRFAQNLLRVIAAELSKRHTVALVPAWGVA